MVPPGFTPAALGAKLLGWWNADDVSTITKDGSNLVSSWKDKVAALDAVQATGSSQPVHTLTSFNGNPGVTFDGVDDQLTTATQPFPATTSSAGIWVLVQQSALIADVNQKVAFGYGAAATTSRSAGRAVVTVTNRGELLTGATATDDTAVDLSSRHVIRGEWNATTTTITVDGGTPVPQALVPNTATTRCRIGANALASPTTSCWNGIIREVIVDDGTLTAGEATSLQTYLLARR